MEYKMEYTPKTCYLCGQEVFNPNSSYKSSTDIVIVVDTIDDLSYLCRECVGHEKAKSAQRVSPEEGYLYCVCCEQVLTLPQAAIDDSVKIKCSCCGHLL